MLKNYHEVREWLEGYIPETYSRKELGLARIENLLSKLGNPHKKFKSIHIAGTSGKGSTAYYIARLLQYSKLQTPNSKLQTNTKSQNSNFQKVSDFGFRTSNLRPTKIGLHVSPHLLYVGERMQINGKSIPVKRLVALVNEIKPVVDEIKSKQLHLTPSYFEILVALSFLYFAGEKVDWAVVEVGLGGRLDATNVLLPEVSVITNIGLDHTEILGDTLEQIAKEKAGIIKSRKVSKGSKVSKVSRVSKGVPVVTGATGKALRVIEKVAKSKNALLINIYTQGVENLQKTDVFRYITKSNDIDSYIPYYVNSECALLAILAVLELKIPFTVSTIKKAFSVQFAGRFEEIEKNIILDGAHNVDKIRALIEFIRHSPLGIRHLNRENDSKGQWLKANGIILVLAFKKGKKWQKMVDLLIKNLPIRKVFATEFLSTTDMGRYASVDAGEIAKYVSKDKRLTTKVIINSQEAVFEAINSLSPLAIGHLKKNTNAKRQKPNGLVLVTGSLYLVGEAQTLWKLPTYQFA